MELEFRNVWVGTIFMMFGDINYYMKVNLPEINAIDLNSGYGLKIQPYAKVKTNFEMQIKEGKESKPIPQTIILEIDPNWIIEDIINEVEERVKGIINALDDVVLDINDDKVILGTYFFLENTEKCVGHLVKKGDKRFLHIYGQPIEWANHKYMRLISRDNIRS